MSQNAINEVEEIREEPMLPVIYPTIIKVEVDMSPFGVHPLKEPTLYDTLTPFEIDLIEVTIQHEVGAFSKQYKTYVAELIYNRVKSNSFPDNVHDVLFQKGQFQGIERWYYSGILPDEDTKQVVKDVFSAENPSHNCIGYYNPALSEYESIMWFEYSGDVKFVFEYSEESWGIVYTTRFFELGEDKN